MGKDAIFLQQFQLWLCNSYTMNHNVAWYLSQDRILMIHVRVINELMKQFRWQCDQFSDMRTGANSRYSMGDISMAAFSAFSYAVPILS